MPGLNRFGGLALGLGILAAACSARPTANADAASAAIENAANQGADQYAPESFKAAQQAQVALDAELTTENAKWFKSYDRANELAAAAKTAGDKAAADAVAGKQRADATAARARAVAAAKAAATRAPVRVGGQIKPPTRVKDVKPIYPPVAQAAHVTGSVMIAARIGPDGKVEEAQVVRSIPLLDQAALDAVKQWEYAPTRLNGVPVPVLTTVTVNFTR